MYPDEHGQWHAFVDLLEGGTALEDLPSYKVVGRDGEVVAVILSEHVRVTREDIHKRSMEFRKAETIKLLKELVELSLAVPPKDCDEIEAECHFLFGAHQTRMSIQQLYFNLKYFKIDISLSDAEALNKYFEKTVTTLERLDNYDGSTDYMIDFNYCCPDHDTYGRRILGE